MRPEAKHNKFVVKLRLNDPNLIVGVLHVEPNIDIEKLRMLFCIVKLMIIYKLRFVYLGLLDLKIYLYLQYLSHFMFSNICVTELK